MVVGGFVSGARGIRSTEILDVNTMTWAMGPPLPIRAYGNKGLKSVVAPYLGFSIGGYRGQQHGKTSKIFGLRKTGQSSLIWEEVKNMTMTRYYHSAVNAPKSLLPNC